MSVLMGMPQKGLPGGPPGHLPHLVQGLRRAGLAVSEETYGSPVTEPSSIGRILTVLRTGFRLRRAQRTGRFDIIHLNTAFDLKALLRDFTTIHMLKTVGPQRTFLKFHGSNEGLLRTRNPFLRLLKHRLLNKASAIGVLSTEEMSNFVNAGVPSRKIFIVKNILDGAAKQPSPAFRRRLGLDSETPIILFAARLVREKGILEVIRACKILRDEGRSVAVLCLGDGSFRRASEKEAERLGLLPVIHFLGHLPEEETAEFYANSTMLAFPTSLHYEGFPMTVFRSVAAGLPVITSKSRAAADYLREPDNCLWVTPLDPEMLARKIMYLLDNAGLRVTMSLNNRECAKLFSVETVTCEFVQIYKTILGRI